VGLEIIENFYLNTVNGTCIFGVFRYDFPSLGGLSLDLFLSKLNTNRNEEGAVSHPKPIHLYAESNRKLFSFLASKRELINLSS
jgi:hypothetical protein